MRLFRKSEPKAKAAPIPGKSHATLVFWLAAAIVFALALKYDYPALTYLCAAAFFYIPAVCIHELGHAISAVCLGGKVHYIALGRRDNTKLLPRKIRFLGFDWYLYSTAFCGVVYSSLYSTRFYRLRRCLEIAAGPGANLLAAAPAICLINGDHFTRFTPLPITWIFINGYLAFSSFSPMEMRPTEGGLKRDILLIWDTFFLSKTEIQDTVRNAVFGQAYVDRSAEFGALDLTQLLDLQQREPKNSALACHIVYRMPAMNDPRLGDCLWKLAALPDVPPHVASELIDNFITNQLSVGPPFQPETTDALSAKLLDLEDSITNRGTRGSILVDLGRIEEGRMMLKEVLIKTTSRIDKIYVHIFLALAAKAEGNLALAREHAEKAAKIDPTCPALKRVSDLLSN